MDFCPICKCVFLDGENAVRFEDFPDVPYHAACVERFGVEKTREVLTAVAAAVHESESDADEAE